MSLRAWAHLPLAGLSAGDLRLGMHPKPVLRGPNAARADVLDGFVLCLHVTVTSCGPDPDILVGGNSSESELEAASLSGPALPARKAFCPPRMSS